MDTRIESRTDLANFIYTYCASTVIPHTVRVLCIGCRVFALAYDCRKVYDITELIPLASGITPIDKTKARDIIDELAQLMSEKGYTNTVVMHVPLDIV